MAFQPLEATSFNFAYCTLCNCWALRLFIVWFGLAVLLLIVSSSLVMSVYPTSSSSLADCGRGFAALGLKVVACLSDAVNSRKKNSIARRRSRTCRSAPMKRCDETY